MPFNFYDTHTLLMAVQQLVPAATFLRDRYFPTNDASDIFATEDVLVEYRDGTRKLAPFVAPRKGGVTILRKGYNMERYTPPFVAPRRTLTLDELRKRGFGEALYSQLTPEQRQQVLIMRDADELGDLITNREEAMAAETMLTNGCIMKHIADDADKSDEMEIRFYSEGANPATYTPTIKWDAEGAKIRADLGAMARMLTRRGLRAADLVCSPDVADAIVEDPDIKEMLDNRRYELGSVAPAGRFHHGPPEHQRPHHQRDLLRRDLHRRRRQRSALHPERQVHPHRPRCGPHLLRRRVSGGAGRRRVPHLRRPPRAEVCVQRRG